MNGPVVHRLLTHVKCSEEEDLIRRAITLGASSPMILELFGLSAKEVAIRCTMLGISHRKGRWPLVGFQEEIIL
ncbi:STY4526/YPO1902 family pathogenicity island replication protein [Pseudomonas gingeri]|uniref:STY4526/YPO1902 family pathogenicity island replication protein n=1 Tax=Pseudomonas gingeri TaxID=117681 RepID=UPI0034E97AB1